MKKRTFVFVTIVVSCLLAAMLACTTDNVPVEPIAAIVQPTNTQMLVPTTTLTPTTVFDALITQVPAFTNTETQTSVPTATIVQQTTTPVQPTSTQYVITTPTPIGNITPVPQNVDCPQHPCTYSTKQQFIVVSTYVNVRKDHNRASNIVTVYYTGYTINARCVFENNSEMWISEGQCNQAQNWVAVYIGNTHYLQLSD